MEKETQTTIALIVKKDHQGPILQETLTQADEILEYELATVNREPYPLDKVFEYREKQAHEEEQFADYVETLLSEPSLSAEVQEHAVKWFKSRVKIETYHKAEEEASKVIARYAFEIFRADPDKTDFILAGPKAKVRIRIFETEQASRHFAA